MRTLICKLINSSDKPGVSIISMNIRKHLNLFVGLLFVLVTNTTFSAQGQGHMSFQATPKTIHPGVAPGVNNPLLETKIASHEYIELAQNTEVQPNVIVVDGPVPPPCQCGTLCPKNALNDTDAISGSLVLVGSLGVGGFAFLRRRRKQDASVVDERAQD